MNQVTKAKRYPIIPSSFKTDIHNIDRADSADLVLFMAGNQFMVMDELIAAFQQQHPEIQTIYYETLPPGMELKQILAGGAILDGQMLPGKPDIFTSVHEAGMEELVQAGLLGLGDYYLYMHNRLTFLVPKGNPANIQSVLDLDRPEVRISQPDPQHENIAFYIMAMYREAGGMAFERRIMEKKRAEGTTIMTMMHHRETPLRIKNGTVDVGPVWATEAEYAKANGLPCEVVEPGADLDQRDTINYYIGKLKHAPNPDNAQKFLIFIWSKTAQKIYRKYGFVPHE